MKPTLDTALVIEVLQLQVSLFYLSSEWVQFVIDPNFTTLRDTGHACCRSLTLLEIFKWILFIGAPIVFVLAY